MSVRTLAALLDNAELATPTPTAMSDNLAPHIQLRPYQQSALQRLVFFLEDPPRQAAHRHLLFHMATGSGKTVIMAAAILYLYARGHRRFLFFVNASQIVEKTRANFLTPTSSKYLFAPVIRIADRTVRVRSVSTFDAAGTDDINLLFTTVQGLHARVLRPRENDLSLDDFIGKKVVLLSDEAHHLNVETLGRRTQSQAERLESWEGTVERIRQASAESILLDFSATVDLAHPALAAKYTDKLLFDYDLAHFRADRYSKDIELRQAQLSVEDRMLQAVVLSQHRRLLAGASGIQLKPVILMKSATIAGSRDNEARFHDRIHRLSHTDLMALRETAEATGDQRILAALDFATTTAGLSLDALARMLQIELSPERCLNANDISAQQLQLNSLEDRDNPIRVIFAVDKLNEGWDVLNLYDIVRLYETRAAKGQAITPSTMREAQLIGRGARYMPFADPDQPQLPTDRRKYDHDPNAPLRLLEVMHYHCAHNPSYLAEMRRALQRTGAMAADGQTVPLRVRSDFKDSAFFRDHALILPGRRRVQATADHTLTHTLPTLHCTHTLSPSAAVSEVAAFGAVSTDAPTPAQPPVVRTIRLPELGRAPLRHAADAWTTFRFNTLKARFPGLRTMTEFFSDHRFLGGVTVSIHGPAARVEALEPGDRLAIARDVLSQIRTHLDQPAQAYEITPPRPVPVSLLIEDRTLRFAAHRTRGGEESVRSWRQSSILQDLHPDQCPWHVYDDCYGTSEEKHLVRFVSDRARLLTGATDAFYLIRNERLFSIYTDSGRALEPAFVLCLVRHAPPARVYQVFIEPRGVPLRQEDAWKEVLLTSLDAWHRHQTAGYPIDQRVLGLPFFAHSGDTRTVFEAAFEAMVSEFRSQAPLSAQAHAHL